MAAVPVAQSSELSKALCCYLGNATVANTPGSNLFFSTCFLSNSHKVSAREGLGGSLNPTYPWCLYIGLQTASSTFLHGWEQCFHEGCWIGLVIAAEISVFPFNRRWCGLSRSQMSFQRCQNHDLRHPALLGLTKLLCQSLPVQQSVWHSCKGHNWFLHTLPSAFRSSLQLQFWAVRGKILLTAQKSCFNLGCLTGQTCPIIVQ